MLETEFRIRLDMRFSEMNEGNLSYVRNLGPRSADALAKVGLKSRADLQRVGGVGAYQLLREQGIPVSKNMAYAIEGALMDVDWRALPPDFKLDINRRIVAFEARRKAGRHKP